ncbi:M23 family metallopeptidase [Clostridium sp. SYSU_GA19001]|uniref:M23 family metallopeptidase n=1 Tax=Clostridium caldaquaticum TaxID=2940653 RepID=UPI002076E8CB|nr:M23 family metallopeptidase [Clostridium caldaquaticum]MCM8710374.1 M23 family metallopeptidase [Clostridium caldaquaticum]
MGNYNSQYESYYSSLLNKRKNYGNYNYNSGSSYKFSFYNNFILKRLTRDLIGVFILFTFIIGCKLIVTQQTKTAYNYLKEMLNTNLDYNKAIAFIKNLDTENIEEKVTNWLDEAKSKILGGKTIKEQINENFVLPIEGDIISSYGEKIDLGDSKSMKNEGINISAKIGTEIICSFKGEVKEVGEDISLGKYILVDHGNGIETKYANLSEIFVKKGDILNKGTVIGKSGNSGKVTEPWLHFELIYMGENKNPEEYLTFIKKQTVF